MRRAMFAVGLVGIVAVVSGCVNDTGESSSGGTSGGRAQSEEGQGSAGESAAGTPCKGTAVNIGIKTCTAPSGTYVALESSTEQEAIVNEIWAVISAPPCWAQDGTSNNYSFYGSYQWRYVGLQDTYAGTIGLVSAGRYEDKNAAVLDLYSGTYLLVVLDAESIALGRELNGAPVITTYKAYHGQCL